jgi:hypothetical protein
MKGWTVAQVKEFLIEKGFDADIASKLETNMVDGEVLEMIGSDHGLKDLNEILKLTPGALLKLHIMVKSYLEEQNQKQPQNQKPRKFGSDGSGISYTEGFRLPPECGSNGLKPAIEYKSGDNIKDAKSLEQYFIDRVAKFACACINQRCNGTIVFGVGDNKVIHYH